VISPSLPHPLEPRRFSWPRSREITVPRKNLLLRCCTQQSRPVAARRRQRCKPPAPMCLIPRCLNRSGTHKPAAVPGSYVLRADRVRIARRCPRPPMAGLRAAGRVADAGGQTAGGQKVLAFGTARARKLVQYRAAKTTEGKMPKKVCLFPGLRNAVYPLKMGPRNYFCFPPFPLCPQGGPML
jgi:hypothetical protein